MLVLGELAGNESWTPVSARRESIHLATGIPSLHLSGISWSLSREGPRAGHNRSHYGYACV